MDIVELAKLGNNALRVKMGDGYNKYMKELSQKAAILRTKKAQERKTEAKDTP